MKKITVAIAGNPNSGKTSIFNMVTGTRQQVGNYPGVTVEKKEGLYTYKAYKIRFVDLPGTYSLSPYSTEELVARRFIIENRPDVVVDVVDCSNIERNLYLATQLMEMNVPMVLAFNMSDIAKRNGLQFDIAGLAELLEVEIVRTVGNKAEGKNELLDAIVKTAQEGRVAREHRVHFSPDIETELASIEELVTRLEPGLGQKYGSRWLALKLLEQDSEIIDKVRNEELKETALKSVERIRSVFKDEPEMLIADKRYGYISGACQETIKTIGEARHSKSDMIDAIVTNPFLGLPIFLLLLYVVFQLTFTVGEYPMGWLADLFAWSGNAITSVWPAEAQWLRSLLVDGIIGGVGGVVVFLPNILLLFLAIAFLEDTGYMARAAFIMDRIMHKIGLHGKSFIPMLIGFGCTVPAIMATRILENKRNRFTTILVLPLMSCGAKLTIYTLIIPAFFSPSWRGPMLWLIYLIGIGLAVVCIRILRVSLFKGETTPFVMELPPYRMPTLKAVCLHTWHRGWMYLKKAGTVILLISILLWVGMNYPKPKAESLEGLNLQQVRQKEISNSVVGRIGKFIEPAIKPLGFDWRIGTALIGATAAKEVFVSQMAIIYAAQDSGEPHQSLSEKLRANYSPLVGFCVCLFCLIYAPCMVTVVMAKSEMNSWFWAGFQFFGLTVLAYVITLIVYQAGSLFAG